jgi:CYTH domain-containing protein
MLTYLKVEEQERKRYEVVDKRNFLSAYVSIRQDTSAYVRIRQDTSAYVSIRQHTSAVRPKELRLLACQDSIKTLLRLY